MILFCTLLSCQKKYHLPVVGVSFKVNHVWQRFSVNWVVRGSRNGVDWYCLDLRVAVMRMAGLRCAHRVRRWATPRPAFWKQSVQVCVLQNQTCHRHVPIKFLKALSILQHSKQAVQLTHYCCFGCEFHRQKDDLINIINVYPRVWE